MTIDVSGSKNQIIGRNLKHIRKEAGLSQPDMAALLDVTFQQIQKYEKGVNRLPITHLHFLRSFLDVPYESFFAGLADVPVQGGSPEFRLKHKLALVDDPVLLIKIEKIVQVLIE